jgi:hypothetical protein
MQRKAYSINTNQKKQIKKVIAETLNSAKGIDFAYVFGSFNDESLPFHDIDLGIFFNIKDPVEVCNVSDDLAIVLLKQVTFPVDVRPLNNAPVTFLYHVMKGELILENNEEVRCQVMERTVREYFDLQPILNRAMKEMFAP